MGSVVRVSEGYRLLQGELFTGTGRNISIMSSRQVWVKTLRGKRLGALFVPALHELPIQGRNLTYSKIKPWRMSSLSFHTSSAQLKETSKDGKHKEISDIIKDNRIAQEPPKAAIATSESVKPVDEVTGAVTEPVSEIVKEEQVSVAAPEPVKPEVEVSVAASEPVEAVNEVPVVTTKTVAEDLKEDKLSATTSEPFSEVSAAATKPVVEVAEEKVEIAVSEPVEAKAEVPVEEPVKAVDSVAGNEVVAEVAKEKVPVTAPEPVKTEAEVPVAELEPVKAVDEVLVPVSAAEPVVEVVEEGKVQVAAPEPLKAESTSEPVAATEQVVEV